MSLKSMKVLPLTMFAVLGIASVLGSGAAFAEESTGSGVGPTFYEDIEVWGPAVWSPPSFTGGGSGYGDKTPRTPDAGTPDAGTPDAGTPDAGTPDAGTPDAGTPDPRECEQRANLVYDVCMTVGDVVCAQYVAETEGGVIEAGACKLAARLSCRLAQDTFEDTCLER